MSFKPLCNKAHEDYIAGIAKGLSILECFGPDRVNPYGLHLGNRLPAHATSAGKILLAHLNAEEQKQWLEKYPLKRLIKYTHTDSEVFLSLLHEIKEQDWCYSCEEHELGVI